MRLIYENVDITDAVQVKAATCCDCAGGVADALELRLENASDWYRWGAKAGDSIELRDQGYTTGRMTVDSIEPVDGDFVVTGCAMPAAAREKRYQSYEQVTLFELMHVCAKQIGLSAALYGVDGGARYRYLERQNETIPAFLTRLLMFEGAVLKCVGGKLAAIGIEWAEAREAVRALEVGSATLGFRYVRMEERCYAACQVRTPYGQGEAHRQGGGGCGTLYVQSAPVFTDAQAAAWAGNRLRMENRAHERIIWDMQFDPALTALCRVELGGLSATKGGWLVESAEHDFIRQTTKCVLLRCAR